MQYYYMKDNENNNREDLIKGVDSSGIFWSIPNDPNNSHWSKYQEWLAADPENNITLEEGE